MRCKGRKTWLMEAWAFIAVAVIAFVAGLLIGDLGSSPTPKTDHVSAAMHEGGETMMTEPSGEAEGGSPGAQDFASAGEEMIVKPSLEVIEGYPANVMPRTYGETLSAREIQNLAEFLVESTPAKPWGYSSASRTLKPIGRFGCGGGAIN
jgi:hypothetical protein